MCVCVCVCVLCVYGTHVAWRTFQHCLCHCIRPRPKKTQTHTHTHTHTYGMCVHSHAHTHAPPAHARARAHVCVYLCATHLPAWPRPFYAHPPPPPLLSCAIFPALPSGCPHELFSLLPVFQPGHLSSRFLVLPTPTTNVCMHSSM